MNRAGETLTNLATFALSLLLAIFIWMSASQSQDPIRTRFLEVPVQYVGLPEDTTLVDVDPRQTVQIRLEGPDTVLQQFTPEDFTAIVDLSQVPSGEGVSVDINVTTARTGAEISFITPEQVDVRLEQQVTREIPVELDIRGSVARGHSQGEPLIEPSTIRVSGPASQVNQLNFALTTIFLNSTVETLVETSTPIFYDQAGRVSSVSSLVLSNDTVSVTVPVEELAGFADKLVTVVWTGEPAPGYRLLSVTADPPTVLVEGRPAQVSSLNFVPTEAIDIDGLTESFQQTAVLDLPAGISVDPEQTVSVRIEIAPILTTSSFNRVPDPRGLRAGYEVKVEPEQVRVVLFGPLPLLDSLAENDVRVILDLFGLEPGTYSVRPEVDIPEREIEIRSVQPSTVTVTISQTVNSTTSLPDVQFVSDGQTPLPKPTTPAPSLFAHIPSICYTMSWGAVSSNLPEICLKRRGSE